MLTFYDEIDRSSFLGLTWERFAQGRMIVGLNSSDGDFNAVGKSGGAKTVTLTTDQIPSHGHIKSQSGAWVAIDYGGTPPSGVRLGTGTSNVAATSKATVSSIIGNTGGGKAHQNMPPYLVASLWRRVA